MLPVVGASDGSPFVGDSMGGEGCTGAVLGLSKVASGGYGGREPHALGCHPRCHAVASSFCLTIFQPIS